MTMTRIMNREPLALPYDGMSVVGFKPHRAPNPQCCSDPGALCPSCAKKALDENVHNEAHDDDLVCNADGEDDLWIDGPVTNHERPDPAPEMAPPSLTGNCSCDRSRTVGDGEGSPFTRNASRFADDSGGRDENASMAPPTINWAEESRLSRHSQSFAAGETAVINGRDPNADMDGELRL
jgi:hypothetical protein